MSAFVPVVNRWKRKRTHSSHPVASSSVNLNQDLFTDSTSSVEEALEVDRIKADYSEKLQSCFYDNDASNPANSVFIKDGDLKTEVQGADRSTITGSELVYETSQTFIECTQDEFLVTHRLVNESETWEVPKARNANTDHIARAVIKFITKLF